MEARRKEFFRELLDIPSPSGFEEAVQARWRGEVSTFCKDLRTDAHGNVIATLPGRSATTSFLLLGHADEIGLLVHYIDDDGFLYFQCIGGVEFATLVNQRVRLLGPKGTVNGVIGRIAPHLLPAADREKAVALHDLCIDIGARNREEAAEHAPVGTPAVIGESTMMLLNGRMVARDFDNKMGCFIVAEVLRNIAAAGTPIYPTVIGASTVQEECGTWGARNVGYTVRPAAAIAIDVSHATDFPACDKKKQGDFKLGAGPIINIGVRTNKKLFAELEQAARTAGIPLHREAEAGRHGTDADPVSEAGHGTAVVTVSNALRYMHTSVEVADLKEIEQIIDLLTAFLLGIDGERNYAPWDSGKETRADLKEWLNDGRRDTGTCSEVEGVAGSLRRTQPERHSGVP